MSQRLLERIRDHATALDQAAPPIRLDDVRAPSRPELERRPRRILGVAAAALLIVGGLVAIYGVRAPDRQPSAVPPSITSEPPDLPFSGDGATPQLNLAGAERTVDELLTVRTTAGAVWKDTQSETYLSLAVREGLAAAYPEPTGLGAMRRFEEVPAELGQFWITDLDAEMATPPQVRMWWTRPDGDVWLLTSYWYEPTGPSVTADRALTASASWATSIVATGDPDWPYELDDTAVADSTMELLYAQRGGETRARTQAWRIDGREVTLVTTEHTPASGLHNLLDAGAPTATFIAGRTAWTAHTNSGEVRAGWWTPDPSESWSALTIPAELAERSNEILGSVEDYSGPPAAPDTSLAAPASEQTTTTIGPTTTIDREALSATWPLSGNWLIHEPTVDPTLNDAGPEALGFAVFSVQTDGDRYVSVGHGRCFTHGGRAVQTDGLTQIAPIEGAAEPAVECDPGPPTQVLIDVVNCLQTGCRLILENGVLDLTNTAGDQIAHLTRTAGNVP